MNLQKLFELQRQLDEHIEREHPRQPDEDRLAKKILALQVELGELANEWRGFKFWSNDQKPRYETVEAILHGYNHAGNGVPASIEEVYRQPLLEEYVDALHFILSIGLELGIENMVSIGKFQSVDTIEFEFMELYSKVAALYHTSLKSVKKDIIKIYYEMVFEQFLVLGERLGLTWEQIEEAYLQKNAVNHQRQESGY